MASPKLRLFWFGIVVILLIQAFAEATLPANSEEDPLSDAEGEDEGALPKKHHPNLHPHPHHHHHPITKKINCNYACSHRCKKASRKKVCLRACKTCCKKCHCVPPGTYGNKHACPCYASLKTHGNKPKCP
ncbi:Gibberellin regulated protein [Dillenia turbinata]|uniref:Gibberellin regulated protein n=1 Tax=Dillenia turbinata TaxID=194707 RepID=A0AAN8ZLF8_9MAGN